MDKAIIVNFDGASSGNPGPAGIGVVFQNSNGTVLKTISHFLGRRTNNQAEYEAFLFALKEALKFRKSPIIFQTDSELLFRQVKGEYRVKNVGLKRYYQRALKLLSLLPYARLEFSPRGLNATADRLAKQAIRNYFLKRKDEK